MASPLSTPVANSARAPWAAGDDAAFRWLGRRYEAVSRDRARLADKLRAILEGRDDAWGPDDATADPVDRVLADIRAGRRDAPAPVAEHYRRLCETEAQLKGELVEAAARHPAWPWLSRQQGVGTTLGLRLLARLDRGRAPRPSSFWAFCGLATMPAYQAKCESCGAELEVAEGERPPRRHAAADGHRCHGHLHRVASEPGASGALRVATSRSPARKRWFDQQARVTCHLIGVQMVRTRGSYEPVYREARVRFERERSHWASGRIHLSALRVMEKRFLLDLWHAWLPPRAAGTGRARRGSESEVVRSPIRLLSTSALSPGRPSGPRAPHVVGARG